MRLSLFTKKQKHLKKKKSVHPVTMWESKMDYFIHPFSKQTKQTFLNICTVLKKTWSPKMFYLLIEQFLGSSWGWGLAFLQKCGFHWKWRGGDDWTVHHASPARLWFWPGSRLGSALAPAQIDPWLDSFTWKTNRCWLRIVDYRATEKA